MANHGEGYKRMKSDKDEEIGVLGPDCGHHCGALTVGHAGSHVRHCPCVECHGDPNVVSHV